jgi:hypothetical protein
MSFARSESDSSHLIGYLDFCAICGEFWSLKRSGARIQAIRLANSKKSWIPVGWIFFIVHTVQANGMHGKVYDVAGSFWSSSSILYVNWLKYYVNFVAYYYTRTKKSWIPVGWIFLIDHTVQANGMHGKVYDDAGSFWSSSSILYVNWLKYYVNFVSSLSIIRVPADFIARAFYGNRKIYQKF